MASLEEQFGLEQRCSQALSSKHNLSFSDLKKMAEEAGFEVDDVKEKKGGSHIYLYKHPTHQYKNNDLLNIQPDKKKKSQAKPSQVEELVKFIREANPKSG